MEAVSPLFDRNTLTLQAVSVLLLQFLQPEVAQELAKTGSFKRDPIARLTGTGKLTAAVLRRDPDAIRRFQLIHARFGRQLMLWVFTTLVITAVEARIMLYGPLDSAQMEALYDTTRSFASDVGIPDDLLPATYKALSEYYWGMISTLSLQNGELRASAEATEIAGAIFAIKRKGIRAKWLVKILGAGLLAPEAQAAYRLRWGKTQRLVWRLIVAWLRRRQSVQVGVGAPAG